MAEPQGAPRATLAYYGDDVTGSVDVLLQFSHRGRTGRLFVGVPDPADLRRAAAEVDVVGIAGIARSLPTEHLDAEVRPALTALRDAGAPLVQYKACSTVDSSPDTGSLGRVLEIAREVFGTATVPLLFAQPDFGRYTAFGHHFAAEGGTVHRLDRQPTMSTHPSTPMDESDISRHLSRQTDLAIGSLPLTSLTSSDRVAAELRDADAAAVVLDTLSDDHLALIGGALTSPGEAPRFVLGSGGLSRAVALALPDAPSVDAVRPAAGGPVLVVSGSRSRATRRQFDAAADAGWTVGGFDLVAPDADPAIAALRAGRSVAVTGDAAVAPADEDPLPAIARAAAHVVLGAVRAGATRRVVVCGGDTSSRVVALLGIRSVSLVAALGGNVVLLRADSDDTDIDGIELLLKGGQVGADDLFERVRLAGG
ncbi:four-carbon acid sugar kinase family protein [Microbacterium sp. NPDC077663]|uniref:four-carbon acid sugar kinase family protein n=1 Tax=Microbacterium sp. NPDC077663 TaxID=3364189 RepID=UPI0037C581FB